MSIHIPALLGKLSGLLNPLQFALLYAQTKTSGDKLLTIFEGAVAQAKAAHGVQADIEAVWSYLKKSDLESESLELLSALRGVLGDNYDTIHAALVYLYDHTDEAEAIYKTLTSSNLCLTLDGLVKEAANLAAKVNAEQLAASTATEPAQA